MGRHPNFDKLELLFEKNKSFSLTDLQYEKKAGIPLPKDKSYLVNRSALAKKCRKYGYTLKVQEKTVFFIKEDN